MIYELARRVKKGVKLLDKKIPNWRRTIKEHRDQFDFENGECCVLGTLEHYNGRMKVLKARRKVNGDYGFNNAEEALNISGFDYGFDIDTRLDDLSEDQYDTLTALWKAEIGL